MTNINQKRERERAVGSDAEEVPNVVNRISWTPCVDSNTVQLFET